MISLTGHWIDVVMQLYAFAYTVANHNSSLLTVTYIMRLVGGKVFA